MHTKTRSYMQMMMVHYSIREVANPYLQDQSLTTGSVYPIFLRSRVLMTITYKKRRRRPGGT